MKSLSDFDNKKEYQEYLRAYFAAMAMQGLISARSETLPENHDAIKISAIAIQIADELLKQIEKLKQ